MKALLGEASRSVATIRALSVVVVTAAAFALVSAGGTARPARGEPGNGATEERPSPAGQVDSARDARRMLRDFDERLLSLASWLREESEAVQRLKDQLVDQQMNVNQAKARYMNAVLQREIAEIAVKEYTMGISVQELQTAEGEIALAKIELDRARDRLEVMKDRQARIKGLADENSASGLAMNYSCEDQVASATLFVEKCKYALEGDQSKKKVLVEYSKEKRTRELESDVKKALSDELGKHAAWDLEQAKLEKIRKAMKDAKFPTNAHNRIRTFLDRSAPIEEQLHARLGPVATGSDRNDGLRKEVVAQLSDLGDMIEEAEAARAAEQFARLKEWLRGSDSR
jgi:hypothetical protein